MENILIKNYVRFLELQIYNNILTKKEEKENLKNIEILKKHINQYLYFDDIEKLLN